MKVLLTLLMTIIILSNSNVYGSDTEYFTPLNNQEILLETVFVFLVCLDWSQTKKFTRLGVEEKNPILGKHPTQEKIDTYIFGGIIAHGFLTYAMPRKYRNAWLTASIIIEGGTVHTNLQLGYSF